MKIFPVAYWHSNWRTKSFSLGATIASQEVQQHMIFEKGILRGRETYLLLCLGFWQLSLGIEIIEKEEAFRGL